MSKNTIPKVTDLPCGPEAVTLEPERLTIRQRWTSGITHDVHLHAEQDLPFAIRRGRKAGIELHDGEAGNVLISLRPDDEDYDVVAVHRGRDVNDEEVIGQAIEALIACRDALKRMRLA